MTDMEVPDEAPVEPTEDWDAVRLQSLKDQFGDEGVADIHKLEKDYDDPDDAVREYRRQLRARGEGEPI